MKRPEIVRAAPLLDLEVAPDGRTVTALAATFDEQYPVEDFDGKYMETINRAAFNRTLAHGFKGRVQALFNHGRTLGGTPSERYSMPLGTPLDIRAEPKGLLTVTRYATSPLADEVLELINDGAITSQSFRGDVYRSVRRGGVIERLELGLRDYGPAPFAVNNGAAILAVRSEILAERLEALNDLSDEDRAELARLLTQGTPGTETPADDPPDGTPTPPADEAPEEGPPLELFAAEAAQRRRRLQLETTP